MTFAPAPIGAAGFAGIFIVRPAHSVATDITDAQSLVVAGVLMIVGSLYLIRTMRSGLYVSERGLVVANLHRTHVVPWGNVRRIGWGSTGVSVGSPCLVIFTRDSVIKSIATIPTERSVERITATVNRYIPAHLEEVTRPRRRLRIV